MTRLIAASLMTVALLAAPAGDEISRCAGLARPVDGPVERTFAPTGRYSGHWGIDWSVPAGTDVRTAGPGIVTFVGTVVGNLTLTVDHGGGLRTSYSYLSTVAVARGDRVAESATLGTTGVGHGSPALHFSVRLGGVYVDPLATLGCRIAAPSKGLRLVPVRGIR